MFIFRYHSEVEQSLASAISDRATDEVLEALTRYKRGMGISDSPNTTLNETPDIVRSRSSHVRCFQKSVKVLFLINSFTFIQDSVGDHHVDLQRHGIGSPTVSRVYKLLLLAPLNLVTSWCS